MPPNLKHILYWSLFNYFAQIKFSTSDCPTQRVSFISVFPTDTAEREELWEKEVLQDSINVGSDLS